LHFGDDCLITVLVVVVGFCYFLAKLLGAFFAILDYEEEGGDLGDFIELFNFLVDCRALIGEVSDLSGLVKFCNCVVFVFSLHSTIELLLFFEWNPLSRVIFEILTLFSVVEL
jgi:hypothetical protein